MIKNLSGRKHFWLLILLSALVSLITISSCGDNGVVNSSQISIAISPTTLDFGLVLLNQSKSMDLKVENTSDNSGIVKAEISGTDKSNFTISGIADFSIDAKSSKTFTVVFSANSERKFAATLTLTYNTSETKIVALSGEGSSSVSMDFSPKVLDYGKVNVGNSKSIKVAVTNVSFTSFSLNPAISGTDASAFLIAYQPAGVIATGKVDSVVVKFTPTSAKQCSAVLTLDASKKYSLQISGEGIVDNDLTISTKSLDFGSATIGNPIEKDITITNITSSPLSVTLSVSSDFTIINQPAGDIPAGAPAKITIRFSPSEMKNYTGTLTITTPNTKHTIQLSGRGGVPSTYDLTANSTATEPNIDGDEDAIWGTAQELSLTLSQIESTYPDKSTYNASIKALHTSEYIYFLVKVKDNTRDEMPNTFLFNGGDASLEKNWTLQSNGQDGISLMFPATTGVQGDDASKTFEKIGCGVTCHTTKSFENYEGGSYPTKGTVDIWYWKAGSTNQQGFADDYFAMGADGKYPNEKRGDEPGEAYADANFRPTGTGQIVPISVPDGDNNGFDKTKFIWDGTSSPFDPAKNPVTGKSWAAGDKVPGWKLLTQTNTFTERADIISKGKYANGTWTVEFKRKLNTENSNNADVVLKAGSSYPFSIAYFDNARYYAKFEYLNLKSSPRPGHVGSNPAVINLLIK